MDRKAIRVKILLLGANGQLGRELARRLPALGVVQACGRDQVDLTSEKSIVTAIDAFSPDVIVNAAAYTAVDKAESERELAFKVNADAVGLLAKEASKRNIWLIHYSTDYVFNGAKSAPYSEDDTPDPINVYGESKLAGEQAIAASGCKHLVFRTTWVIGKDGQNFAKTILRLAAERDSLGIIDDQYGVPTTPGLITRVTVDAIEAMKAERPWPPGLYHLAPRGRTTWYGIARTLLQLAQKADMPLNVDESNLRAIKTSEYPTPAKRPANSLLVLSKLEEQLGASLPEWEEEFAVVANDIIEELKAV